MEKILYICDMCKREEAFEKRIDSSYRTIEFSISEQGRKIVENEFFVSGVAETTRIALCPDCQKKIGIYEKKIKLEKSELDKRIFDIFAHIADRLGYVRDTGW